MMDSGAPSGWSTGSPSSASSSSLSPSPLTASTSSALQELFTAINQGDEGMANLILIAQPDLIRATDKMGQAAIHIAAGIVDNTNLNINGSPSSGSSGNGGRKSLEMVKLLVSRHGANVNARDHNEWTALHVACSAGNLRTVELLLAYGANVNAIALDGSTPLHYLVRYSYGGDTSGIEESTETNWRGGSGSGGDEEQGGGGRDKVLFFSVLQSMLGKGADLNAQNINGETCLHIATFKGKDEVVKVLLDNKADLHVPNRFHETCLHIAARLGNESVASLLLDHGSDPNDVSQHGTPRDVARKEGHTGIILLLDAKAKAKKFRDGLPSAPPPPSEPAPRFVSTADNDTPRGLVRAATLLQAQLSDASGDLLSPRGEISQEDEGGGGGGGTEMGGYGLSAGATHTSAGVMTSATGGGGGGLTSPRGAGTGEISGSGLGGRWNVAATPAKGLSSSKLAIKFGQSANPQLTKLPQAHESLKEILLQPSMKIVMSTLDALGDSDEFEQLIAAFVLFFVINGKIMDLLKQMIAKEVRYTVEAATLFRTDSVATKLMTAYARLVGGDYLRACLLAPVTTVCGPDYDSTALEIDPNKLTPENEMNIEQHAQNLQVMSDIFLDSIFAQTTKSCPPGFRELCGFLQKEVGAKFPSYTRQAVAGFLFLRFLCPAVVSPSIFGLLDAMPKRNDLRGLLLVSKLLQILANGVQPMKQTFMFIMGGYTAQKITEVDAFLDSFPTEGDTQKPEDRTPAIVELEKDALDTVQRLMRFNIHKIGRVVVTSSFSDDGRSSREMAVENADKQGYLKKKGELSVKPWRTRWFVLKERFLYYFKSPQHATSAGVIPLEKCRITSSSGSSSSASGSGGTGGSNSGMVSGSGSSSNSREETFCFELVTGHRTYYFMAVNEREGREWMAAIQRKIDDVNVEKERDRLRVSQQSFSATSGDKQASGGGSGSGSGGGGGSGNTGGGSGSAIASGSGSGSGSASSSGSGVAGAGAKEPEIEKTRRTSATAKQGFLTKQGNVVKNWKRRWFVLKDHLLFYYKSQNEGTPRGEIPIQNCFVRRSESKEAETPYCFELTVADRTFIFCASDELSMKSWMDAIKRSKNEFWKAEQVRKQQQQQLQQPSASSPSSLSSSTSGSSSGVSSASSTSSSSASSSPSGSSFLASSGSGFGGSPGGSPTGSVIKEPTTGRSSPLPQIGSRIGRALLSSSARQALIKPEREGYLQKQGDKVKSWNRRWCVVSQGKLYYFNSPQDTSPIGHVEIKDAAVEPAPSGGAVFEIVTRERRHFFRATDMEEMKLWINDLLRSVDLAESASSSQQARAHMKATTKIGWLHKQGAGGTFSNTWRKRWIVLQYNLLSYYKTAQDADPAGVIPLENSSVQFTKDKACCFEIFTQYRKYFFMAQDDVELTEWVEAIQQAKTWVDRTDRFMLNAVLSLFDRPENEIASTLRQDDGVGGLGVVALGYIRNRRSMMDRDNQH